MKIDKIFSPCPEMPEVKVVHFARFTDERGFFTETFNKDNFTEISEDIGSWDICQINESFSQPNVFRGFHFQWNPYMGKLVRVISGHMVDLFIDIRLKSPTYGKIFSYDMHSAVEHTYNEWLWVPVGFAHGVYFSQPTIIQYLCSGEYSNGHEASISPLAEDIDWSLCLPSIEKVFKASISKAGMTQKDRNGFSLEQWSSHDDAKQFIYE